VATRYPPVHAGTRTNTHTVATTCNELQPSWQTWGTTFRYAVDRLVWVAPNLAVLWFASGHR
jgi:hypothetical protein